ncbi:DNA-binding GntR family transcriptional regulator [Microbacterium phyllosphaerae]|uniref:DNA-binding GntR family transcriptional regulator n=1 Tax=Microbacterium phyllosphaerae TaxID=124798 RepID=A0ABS4WMX4_9MICO|nr:GntR family transcriptional regulator [Microbacterium phyllosphaerae]MBP2377557.1 DNA-binding GntR family transcriptional regulator [Microbacterium phyllosphaerae]
MPTTDAPQPRRLLRDEVYDTILGAILDGTLEPGEILHDEELMTWLGSSRTPIREALNRLAEEDVVELVPHRHTRVAPVNVAAINEGLFVTGAIHEHIARSSAADLTDTQIAEFAERLSQVEAAALEGDAAALGRTIREYFLVLVRATPNSVLRAKAESLSLQLVRFLTPRENLRTPQQALEFLRSITAALAERDGERAGDFIHELHETTRSNFIEFYRETDPTD